MYLGRILIRLLTSDKVVYLITSYARDTIRAYFGFGLPVTRGERNEMYISCHVVLNDTMLDLDRFSSEKTRAGINALSRTTIVTRVFFFFCFFDRLFTRRARDAQTRKKPTRKDNGDGASSPLARPVFGRSDGDGIFVPST